MNSHNKPSVRLAHTRTWGCTCSPCFLLLNNLQLKITVETWMFSQKKKKKPDSLAKFLLSSPKKGATGRGEMTTEILKVLFHQLSEHRCRWTGARAVDQGEWGEQDSHDSCGSEQRPVIQGLEDGIRTWWHGENQLFSWPTDTVSKIACHWHAFSLSLSLSLPLPLSPFVKREVPLLGWPSPGLLIRNPQSQAHWRVGSGLLNIYQTPQVRSTREMIKTNAASVCIWIPGRSY